MVRISQIDDDFNDDQEKNDDQYDNEDKVVIDNDKIITTTELDEKTINELEDTIPLNEHIETPPTGNVSEANSESHVDQINENLISINL